MSLKDLPYIIETCSFIHQRYNGFSKILEENLKKQFTSGDVVKKRNILRFIAELIMSGI